MTDAPDVGVERMKLCYMEFTHEETDGVNNKRSSSSVRGEDLGECLKYTRMLHNGEHE